MVSLSTLESIATKMPATEGAGIRRAVAEISAKAGVESPEIYLIRGPKKYLASVNPILEHFPAGVMHVEGKNVMIFGREFNQRVFGIDIAKYETIGEDFMGIIAHEFGHVTRGDGKFPLGAIWRSNLSPVVGLAGGIAGMYALRSILIKKPEPKPVITQEEVKQATAAPKGSEHTFLKGLATVAEYSAAAAAGLAVGFVGFKRIRHSMEYACDAYSAKIMGSPEPLRKGLSKLMEEFNRIKEETCRHMSPEMREKTMKASKSFEEMMHPPLPKRIEALR